MTSEAKRALALTIRKLRGRLIEELGEVTEGAYRLSIEVSKAALGEAARFRRERLAGWIDEQVRALPEKARSGAAARLHGEVIKDAAATLLQRLIYLRLLEAAKLRPVAVVTGGWESRGYKDFREETPELMRPAGAGGGGTGGGIGDDSEGYARLLQLVFDELALELPGLYGPVRMTSLVPVPAATLRAVVTALDDDELATVWTDDTTLGWIHQYWNDPEREALDAKLAASKKLENHEIAAKTQMFTERYMVEWLLHNSLGQMWLAICRKHDWTADVERVGAGARGSVLDRLEARRVEWRAKREAGEVALDALMPIESGLEDRWKYWVPQPMPEDAVAQAPESVRSLKLLDPACGSGHFLVIAFELLFHLYREEARHRGEAGDERWSERAIVESILEHNLHGIDIDPRVVQIAAAALMLKARRLCAGAEPRMMNLVAPNLSLARLAEDDPALLALYAAVEREIGIPPVLTGRIIAALAGADHLGTLLEVDAEIDAVIGERDQRITAEHAKATLRSRLERFLDHHASGPDLGLRLRDKQLAAGVRFIRMMREGQYDLVAGNPPYQGTSKMADNAYIERHYPRGKADLYAAFLERGLQLARPGGTSALLTMRNWMFIRQFSALREWLLATYDLRMLGDVDRGAFEDISDEVVTAIMSIVRRAPPRGEASIAVQPTPLDDKARDGERTRRKRAALLLQVGRHDFDVSRLKLIDSSPLVYWWTTEDVERYASAPKLASIAPGRAAQSTSGNDRFSRFVWEVEHTTYCRARSSASPRVAEDRWHPFINGANGRAWLEPLERVLSWKHAGLEIKQVKSSQSGREAFVLASESFFYQPGIAFTMIGNDCQSRAHRYASIMGDKGSSVFPDDIPSTLAAMNRTEARGTLAALNPSVSFQVGDINRLPVYPVSGSAEIFRRVEEGFELHESHRETSVEFKQPGPSCWSDVQKWAQAAVDRDDGVPLPVLDPRLDEEPRTDHLSFALGVALGRFGSMGEGILEQAPPAALRHGILFLSDVGDHDSLAQAACAPLLDAWAEHGPAIAPRRTLKSYLQDRFFPDVHRKMYENRPIYFPLSSSKKSFVAYVSIHRWTAGTLDDLLAEHLYPTKRQLEGEQTDLRDTRAGAGQKAAKSAEKRFGDLARWLEELNDFIANVEQCAEKGPLPPDGKTTPREVDARYDPDLGDGVMINAAALWPLLEPQWKDPKKWWRELANAEGKKDHDWAHLARRYFPERVDGKCKLDPSLAVAHGCFWKYYPAKAHQWELRLQDEIRPGFTLDEVGSDAARAAFEVDHPGDAQALVTREHQRRLRKRALA